MQLNLFEWHLGEPACVEEKAKQQIHYLLFVQFKDVELFEIT